MNKKFLFVKKSSNRKTGPIPVTTSARATCPNTCPLKNKGCYADGGPLRIHWQRLDTEGLSYKQLLEHIINLPYNQVWRHNQAGDLLHTEGLISGEELFSLFCAASHTIGFTYTHHDIFNPHNQKLLSLFSKNPGLTINISTDSIEDALVAKELNIGPVTTIVPSYQTQGFKVTGVQFVICPAAVKENITCASCKLCTHKDRKSIICFPVHGNKKKSLNERLQEDEFVIN